MSGELTEVWIDKQRLETDYGSSTVEIDTALKQGVRVGGLVTKAPSPPPLPSADACAIDSLQLTSATSEQQSIQQITAREATGGLQQHSVRLHRRVCMLLFVCAGRTRYVTMHCTM